MIKAISIFGICFVSLAANASSIYLLDGDNSAGFIVDLETKAVTPFNPTWEGMTHVPYPISALNNKIYIGARDGRSSGVFSSSGEFKASFDYSFNGSFDQLLDGTTDGKRNYAVRYGDEPQVVVAGLNWENPEVLFQLPDNAAGITYDRKRKSLWVGGYDNVVTNYSLTGQILTSFNIGRYARGLSYDPKTDTLWLHEGNTLYNYSLSGELIQSFEAPLSSNIFGGEIMFPFGPGAEETLLSMRQSAAALRNVFNLQSAKIAQGLSYDCTLYDQKNICVSFVGSKSDGKGFDETTGALIVAHKPTPNFRLGGYIDQATGSSTSGGLTVKKGSPGYGVFGVWSENANGSGVQVRASANQGKVDMETTRTAIEFAEAGFGKSDIKSNGFQLEVSRDYALNSTWTARPAIGYRKTTNTRAGYTEQSSDAVTAPLTYTSIKQNTETVLAGVTFEHMLSSKTGLSLTAGVEHDLKNSVGKYQAVNIDIGEIDAIDMGANKRKTRPTLSFGMNHNIDKTQRIGVSVTHRKEAFESASSTSAFIQYSKGF